MDEKDTIQLQKDQTQLESSSSQRNRLSMSQRNWKKMETSSKASLLKKVSKTEIEKLRKQVGKGLRQPALPGPLSPKKPKPRKDLPKEPLPQAVASLSSLSKSRGLSSRWGRRVRFEARQLIVESLLQEDSPEEEPTLKQEVRKGGRLFHEVNRSLSVVSSRLSTSAKSRWLSPSSREELAKKKRVSPKKQGTKVAKREAWGFLTRRVAKVFSTSVIKWSAWGLGGVLLLLLIVAGVLGQTFPIQSEYDLNETYLYMTQLDRKQSTDKVVYSTNWEDSLLYLHYRYDTLHEDPRLDANYHFMDQHAGRVYVEDLWKDLNQDPSQLKTIQDLYRQEKTKYSLSKEEQAAFEELMEGAKELGKFAMILELDNPFYLEKDPKAEEALNIKERFGYQTRDKKTDTTLLALAGNHPLYAPLRGTVSVKDGAVTIETPDAKFTFYQVTSIRVTDGQEVETGTQIGQSHPAGDQRISYQKKLSYTPKSTLTNWNPAPREDWFYVNPGFYFKSVRYLEETYLTAIDVDAGKAQRVQLIKNYLSRELQREGKSLSLTGLASMLGNFDVESSITAKRAEGDYLPPPIGASPSSWDDPNWLSMNGPAIYRGSYPNILHRGLGLGQWTDTADGSRRHTLLLDYAKSRQKKWYDLELQLDFMLHGDSPYYQAVVWDILTSGASTDDLTLAFLIKWEGNSGDKLAARRQSARQWEGYLKGGTSSTGSASQTVPAAYKDKLPYGLPSDQAILEGQGYPGNAYALGNCTWYVYNRFYQIGQPIDPYLGNATNWVTSSQLRGYRITLEPRAGSAVVFLAGVGGSHPVYGHVGFCEAVGSDGTFLMSEMNAAGGIYSFSWRVLAPQAGIYFITPN